MKLNTKVIISGRHLLLKIIMYSMLIFGVIGVVAFTRSENAKIHDFIFWTGCIAWIGMFLCFLFIVVYGLVVRGFKVIGEISFSDSGIITEIDNITGEFNLEDIQSCEFKIKGFDGESPIMRSSSCFKGNYNYVTIRTKKGNFTFEFYLAGYPTIRSLYRFIIAEWINKGVSVVFNYPNHKLDK